jgi:hypothetical protein
VVLHLPSIFWYTTKGTLRASSSSGVGDFSKQRDKTTTTSLAANSGCGASTDGRLTNRRVSTDGRRTSLRVSTGGRLTALAIGKLWLPRERARDCNVKKTAGTTTPIAVIQMRRKFI